MNGAAAAGIPAATLVVFRRAPRAGDPPEILMTVRSRALAFAGGMAVFPGGRVDPSDHDLARTLAAGVDADADELAHRIAAVRETLEETGLLLGVDGTVDRARAQEARALLMREQALQPVLRAFDLTLVPERLVPFARWLPTGLGHARTFDTRFYLADVGTGAVELEIDRTETSQLFWTSARAALAEADTGRLRLIFPTRRNLERLALFGSFAEAREHARDMPVRTITPVVASGPEGSVLRIPDDLGYPVTSEPLGAAERG